MQGQQNGDGFFPELGFEHGSTSQDAGLNPQMYWNSIGNAGQSPLSNFLVSSVPIVAFDGSLLQSETQQHSTSNVLLAGDFNVNLQRNGVVDANETPLLQNSGSHQLDLNMNSGLVEDDGCQVHEGPPIHKPSSSRIQPTPFGVSDGNSRYLFEDIVRSPEGPSNGRHLSCKRKILEGSVEQQCGSGSGSASYVQHSERNLWHVISDGSTTVAPLGGTSHSLNRMEQVNPILRSNFGQTANESSILMADSGAMESSRRNSRPRMNRTHQQASLSSSINLSSSQHSLNPIPQNSLTIGGSTFTGPNTNLESQPGLAQLSSLNRNLQSGWQSPSINSSSFTFSGERNTTSFDLSNSVGVPRNISDHPMFTQPIETRNSLRNAPTFGLLSGNVNNPGNAGPSQIGPGLGANGYPHQSTLHYPNRALLSAADSGSRGQNSNHPSLQSHGVSLSSGTRRHGRYSQARQAMLLERHLGGTPFSLHALAGANDGRTRLMSEIRNALELVRRGEGLRLEDAMILNQSIFFGMADIHDRHRDMRLDVDNMSYEELLALEERIGSVSTGLSEESIIKQLKQKKHAKSRADETEIKPCCICQEEYKDGEDMGILDCGHDFHCECIKQWLMNKNLCPICKTAGLTK